MTRKRMSLIAAAVSVLLISQLGGPAVAEGDDQPVEGLQLLPHALALTAADNQVYLAESLDTSTDNNWSCRLEIPVLVQQPEIDSRITVKGEDTAATSAECVNIEFGPDTTMSGAIWLEWLNPDTGKFEVIRDNDDNEYEQPCQLGTVRGVGVLPCVIDVVFPANHYAAYLGAIHRAGARLDAPQKRGPYYSKPLYYTRFKADL